MATHNDRLWRLHLRRSLGEMLTADEQSEQSIQAIANENEVLRRENMALRQQMA